MPFDLVIIGGGIHGCGIARDAAMRGLRVALFEKGDIGSGTSSSSSKLVHGGLRYLEQLRFGLVRESLRERSTLLAIAPHLVRPLPFLLPLYEDARVGSLKLRAGLTIYDFLAGRDRIERHGWLSAVQVANREPHLNVQKLRGGFHFVDAQMNDARLCLENAVDARIHGAQVWNYVEVERLTQSNGRITGVACRDLRDGHRFEVGAQLVINATGPWYSELRGGAKLAEPTPVRLSKGSHLVFPKLTEGHALLLTARQDGRAYFILPYKGCSIVGTTEVEVEASPDAVEVSTEEEDYLLAELEHALGEHAPKRKDILARFCGVRALRHRKGESLGELSREAEIVEEAPGLVGVIGGKYTTYRAIAERCVNRAMRLLQRERIEPSQTATKPLPGGDFPDMDAYFQMAEKIVTERYQLEPITLRYLLGTYGARHAKILELFDKDPSLLQPLELDLPFTRGEIVFAARYEGARTLDDLIWRRTYRAFLGPLDRAAQARWEDALRQGNS